MRIQRVHNREPDIFLGQAAADKIGADKAGAADN
jgi:hypothetical protein